jgi:putative transposase
MFKKRTNLPKFKSKKKSKASYPIRSERMYFREDNCIQIEKLGRVKYKSDFTFPVKRKNMFMNARILIVGNKYMLSFNMDCENQTIQLTQNLMGIDLGVKDLAVVSYGNDKLVFHNINKSKKVRMLEKKLKYLQKSISRKYELSKSRYGVYRKTKNIEREENEVRKIYARLTSIRHNYLHQITHRLISMAPKRITMETLNILDMMKNKFISKEIHDQCFYEFIRQIKYKCEWNNIEFIQVPRFYPSSKTCSFCGNVKRDLKLTDRTYVCLNCGCVIDRDYNAAINLMRYEV